MNKNDFIGNLVKAGDFKQEVAIGVYKVFVETLKISLLQSGGKVSLPELGRFEVTLRKARFGVNPNTGKKIEIPEKKTVKYKPAKQLLDELNGN